MVLQVDIVFESEDESFYSALSTLIGNTKRPIVLTLGSKQERDLLTIKDKIRTCFDVVRFASPDLLTTCNAIDSFIIFDDFIFNFLLIKMIRWLRMVPLFIKRLSVRLEHVTQLAAESCGN